MIARFSVLVLLACATTVSAQEASWRPDRPVELVVGSSPGGGNDKTARVLQKIWQDAKVPATVNVVNKVGGGGAVAYNYVAQHAGNPHYLGIARPALLTNHILGRGTVNYPDFMPIAVIASEPTAFAVRADAPMRSAKDLVAKLKSDPQSLAISLGSTRGSTTHFVLARVAKAGGIDPRLLKTLTFGGGADSVTQLLGGHIDVISSSVDNVAPHHRNGTMRIISISTANRLAALPDVPTLREQGYDVVQGGWVVIVAPRSIAPAHTRYWDALFEKTVADPQWRRYLEGEALEADYLGSKAVPDFLRREYDNARALLADLGMIK